ncbi:MAG: MotA/TolQ/ExbB proton channel family protein [bacterium]
MWQYFLKGGFMMWPLFACSVISLAIIIERFFYFRKLARLDQEFLESLSKHLHGGAIAEATAACTKFATPLALVLRSGLEKLSQGKEAIKISIEESSMNHTTKLEKYLPFLAAIASVSTLMGFTGTVLGMIKAFGSIAREGVSSPAIVASGIGEALITTATGLLIAIPTVIAYHYFNYRVDNEYRIIESYSNDIANINYSNQ